MNENHTYDSAPSKGPRVIFHRIDLSDVRRDASSYFRAWNELITAARFEEARRLRLRQLWPFIKQSFQCEALARPGVYMFSDNSGRSGWESLIYFGQTAKTLRNRLDHYIREDSCWDDTIVRQPERLRDVALGRLRPIMPSTPETLEDHIIKHQTALRRTRGCSLFVAGFGEADAEFITAVEAALIAVCWTNGAPLENEKLEKLPSGSTRASILGICEQVFRGWNGCGLNDNATNAALKAFRRASEAGLE